LVDFHSCQKSNFLGYKLSTFAECFDIKEKKFMSNKDWPLWEIFIRSKSGLAHKHCGSLHAADAEMAIENARDVYTRRMEGVSIWVVPSQSITASSPDEKDILFDPANDKIYRHPTFYEIPPEVGHM
jgi:ring-1,2-phenylacetyl-CoA epoxidase subunit PaaB